MPRPWFSQEPADSQRGQRAEESEEEVEVEKKIEEEDMGDMDK